MTKLMTSIVAVALLSGCAATAKNVKDLSTGEETAFIDGNHGRGSGLIVGKSCEIIWPVVADLIVIDPGPAIFVESCSLRPMTKQSYRGDYMAVIQFVAEAGHTYKIKATDVCIKLLDVTADSHVVDCYRYFIHRFKDLSTGDDTAIIRSGINSINYCSPTMGRKLFGYLLIDSGPITIDVTCRKTGIFGGHPRLLTSSFDFEAQAGHTYAFSTEDDECIKLLDITSDESIIACESYEQHDEEK